MRLTVFRHDKRAGLATVASAVHLVSRRNGPAVAACETAIESKLSQDDDVKIGRSAKLRNFPRTETHPLVENFQTTLWVLHDQIWV